MKSKKNTKAVNLMTNKMQDALNGRILKFSLKSRGYTVLRTNSSALGSSMPAMDGNLNPDPTDILQLED
jgi:hypothetical protein